MAKENGGWNNINVTAHGNVVLREQVTGGPVRIGILRYCYVRRTTSERGNDNWSITS